ncbi:hypothetical protein [Ruegeria sp. HKCCA0235A]|uniref:hypothetical protein n=1 Tax=Ruegeria sp. HKCCA0235A TaxID=2682998 RepID=UPI00148761CF|nr:hypothetical protein [Ruegeria sp. HKCCA0235A]
MLDRVDMKKLIDGEIELTAHREATHAIYKTLHEQFFLKNCSLKRANNVIGNLLGASASSWRVVGITPAALELFKAVDFKARPRGIQRAHKYNRIDTVKEILETDQPLSEAELFNRWISKDVTVLCLNKENRNILNNSYIEIENPEGELFSNAYIGYTFRRTHEGQFLSDLWQKKSMPSV